jgi:hypothetical protein
VAGCCECGDEPSGSCATELVIMTVIFNREVEGAVRGLEGTHPADSCIPTKLQ